jgi:hypothetical protein
MGTQPPRYLAYLVRLWQVQDQGEFVWRASLEDAHTGERHGFASLEALVAFLVAETGGRPVHTIQVPTANSSPKS